MTASQAEPRAAACRRASARGFLQRPAGATVLLVMLNVVAGLVAIQCTNRSTTPTGAHLVLQLCVSGATQASEQFSLVQGYITYTYGSEIWAVDPKHPGNPISLGQSNGLRPIAWSRDGSRLLLRKAGTNNLNGDLCVLNADGSQTQLTKDGRSGEGSFSPDGTKVVFARIDDGLYVVSVRGGAPRLIAKSYTAWWLESPAWSPDGSRIAYMVYLEGGPEGLTYQIWTGNPDGTDPRPLVDLGECGGGGCSGGLAWSPDGSALAFQTRRDVPLGSAVLGDNQSIYVVQADGSGLHRISDDGFQPSWSPDGSRIAFLRSYGFAEVTLFTMARDGGDVRQVEGVFVQPSYMAWSPVG